MSKRQEGECNIATFGWGKQVRGSVFDKIPAIKSGILGFGGPVLYSFFQPSLCNVWR